MVGWEGNISEGYVMKETSGSKIGLSIFISIILLTILTDPASAFSTAEQDHPIEDNSIDERENEWNTISLVLSVLCGFILFILFVIMLIIIIKYNTKHNCPFCFKVLNKYGKTLSCTDCGRTYERTFFGNLKETDDPKPKEPEEDGYRPNEKW